MEITTKLYLGDCKEELRKLSENSIDLVFTSPLMRIKGRGLMVAFVLMNMLIGFYLFQRNFSGC
jgi:DNA modification methylase